MIFTTLNKIRERSFWFPNYDALLKSLRKTQADDEPLSLECILNSTDFGDALRALHAVEGYQKAMRLLACHYAKHVLHAYEKRHPGDTRPVLVITIAEMYARGLATHAELAATKDVARDVMWSAVWNVVGDVREDVREDAAWDAVRTVARDAMETVAWDASPASMGFIAQDATQDAAWAIAELNAWGAVLDSFKHEFRQFCRLEGKYGSVGKE